MAEELAAAFRMLNVGNGFDNKYFWKILVFVDKIVKFDQVWTYFVRFVYSFFIFESILRHRFVPLPRDKDEENSDAYDPEILSTFSSVSDESIVSAH